ncbi:hypothetical protein HDU76_007808 [Blyttiomyces sp. JEL0837]|nr:hypothetical protein HDU76_007808 [Blyttiomyces sp. JEL0837]
MSSDLLWFLLVDAATGLPYRGTTATSVSLPPDSVVDQFRDAVKAEKPNKLSSVDASDLVVYKNKDAFDKRDADEGKEEPLDPTESLGLLGSKEDMLVVVVPSSTSSSESLESIEKEPHPKRKRRWIQLNERLALKKAKENGLRAYSSVTWSEVHDVFNPTRYVQPRKDMDASQLDILAKYLSNATYSFAGNIRLANEAKRLHFIAPVLVCVCRLLKDVKIEVEVELNGNFVKAEGRFEFMIKRKNKAVCIIEAKKNDLNQGMAQDLIGCEVAAERHGLDVVYGIVCNLFSLGILAKPG